MQKGASWAVWNIVWGIWTHKVRRHCWGNQHSNEQKAERSRWRDGAEKQ